MSIIFDQYQRYRNAELVINRIRKGKETFSILEVGANEHKNLELFLPEDDIKYLDINLSEERQKDPKYILGDATRMEFEDGAFDIIVALDVFEHIPKERREDFLGELDRVSKRAFVMGAPFDAPGVSAAEKRLNELFASLYGENHLWLVEHIENGLPDLQRTRAFLGEKQILYKEFGHGSLDIWERIMKMHFFSVMDVALQNYVDQIYDLYNSDLFSADYTDDSYRRFFVGFKNPDDFGRFGEMKATELNISELLAQQEKTFYHIYENETIENKCKERQDEIDHLLIENEELSRKYNELLEKHESMTNSLSWKVTKPVRSFVPTVYQWIHGHRATAVACDGTKYLFHNGIRATFRRARDYYGKPQDELSAEDFLLSEEEFTSQRDMVFGKMPKISILVPLYNTPENFLREMIESVTCQTYGNWQLCLADGSDDQHSDVEKICREYVSADPRILYKHLEENKGIAENTNECIRLADGDYIGLFDHDDLLMQDALFEIVKRINEKEDVDAVYTDEDKLLYRGKNKPCKYVEPHFKSDYNLDLLRTNNYICHFFVVKKSIVDKVGGFRKDYDGSQDYDFIFRCVEQAETIEHIAKILYHWRIHENSTAANPQSKMYCYEAGKRAIESHLQRMGIRAEVIMLKHLGFYKVRYPVQGEPLVSIIIPNKDERKTLQKCIASILKKTAYRNYEIIIVENNSTSKDIFEYYHMLEKNKKIKVVRWEDSFNYSKINNFGVRHAKGEYILLLNNDVEVINGDWLSEMIANCQRPEVGIVGAKLLYPDNTVQHGGVIIGLGGIAGHAFVGKDGMQPGYFGRAFVQQNLSAVTAACLMVRRSVFEEVGGLEETLQVAFNDVDFCLKVRRAGYLVVMNPSVLLYHYESKTRGAEDTPEKKARFDSEIRYMAEHWKDILENGDPYYNRNLTLIRGDFSMRRKGEPVPTISIEE